MAATEIDSKQRRKLRALAHHLKPVVQVGQAGVSDEVIAAVEQALLDHELIKVQMREPEDKKAMAQQLAAATGAALCGLLGHVVLLYRPHPEKPRLQLD
ncbi:MAG TPA: ribosome assembly RNA-binding protein YhbY [Terriglobales bacterium]|nr:ribosome assembly RNA-binding protein YhbY [Terriglobales bacterium]